MNIHLTLVAANDDLKKSHFEKLNVSDSHIKWLIPNKVAFIKIENTLPLAEMKKFRVSLNKDKIDIFCVEQKPRHLFMADMDSTIVTSETLDELADEVGIKDQVATITERAMRGELDFHAAIKERVALLKDLPLSALEKTLQNTQISTGADTLLAELKKHNLYCVLVSGGFTQFTAPIASQLGFDKNHGNQFEIKNNALTGKVIEPILDKDSKLKFLHHYCTQLKLDLSDSIAIGDGANDLPMLENAGLGIGYQPKPLVAEKILNCIIHTDLTSVLYMQGLTA